MKTTTGNTRRLFCAGAAALLLAATGVQAQPAMVDGEVRKVDREAGKLTLKHGRIEHLDMPPMTMVFRVADLQLLDGLKDGDRVRFAVDKRNGLFTVTAIAPAK